MKTIPKNRQFHKFEQCLLAGMLVLIMTIGNIKPVRGDVGVRPTAEETYRALAAKAGTEPDEILSSDLLAAGDSTSDWIAFLGGRLDHDGKSAYLKKIEEAVTKAYETKGGMDAIRATEWSRPALVIMALGGNPEAIGRDSDGKPVDLIADGIYNWHNSDDLGMQGLNAWIYALLALDAGAFETPSDAVYDRKAIITAILNNQTDGAFGLTAGNKDVDITAMALQALAPYRDDETVYLLENGDVISVKEAIDRALTYLSEQQAEDGGFSSYGESNTESCAQVIMALCALGIDPSTDEQFTKSGIGVVDNLLSFRTTDGCFRHTHDDAGDYMATEQAARALLAIELYENDASSLYNLTTIKGRDETLEGDISDKRPEGSENKTESAHSAAFYIILILMLGAFAAALWTLIKRGEKYRYV